jgi:hypothetical protein
VSSVLNQELSQSHTEGTERERRVAEKQVVFNPPLPIRSNRYFGTPVAITIFGPAIVFGYRTVGRSGNMNSASIETGPGIGRRPQGGQAPSDEASEQIPRQRGVEESSGADDSLVKQMSHGDESIARESDTDTRGVVGYVDEHGIENRPEEGTREYDKE